MSTASQVYTAIADAIQATTVVQSHKGDSLRRYEGPLEEMPLRDRTFVLQSTSLDRVTERMGCQEWRLGLEAAIVYQLTSGANARALLDVQAISDAVLLQLGSTGITDIDELGSSIDISERFITTTLTLSVSFSEGG